MRHGSLLIDMIGERIGAKFKWTFKISKNPQERENETWIPW